MFIPWVQTIIMLFLRHLVKQFTHSLKLSPNANIIQPLQFVLPENIISISPGGFLGIYMFGVCTFIKDHYHLDPYVFSGASAGAWNALMMTYNPPTNVLLHDIHLGLLENKELDTIRKVKDVELWLKQQIIRTYDPTRFDLSKLYIGTTTFNVSDYKPHTTIFHDFKTLDEAIDCCIASSHIPFVTGGMLHRFRSQITFDGGFSRNPYLTNKAHALHIKPSMWSSYNTVDFSTSASTNNTRKSMHYTTMFSRDAFNFKELYEKGYSDAKTHKPTLDTILRPK